MRKIQLDISIFATTRYTKIEKEASEMGIELSEIQTRYMYMYVSRVIHMYLRYNTRVVGEMRERRGRRIRLVMCPRYMHVNPLRYNVSITTYT